MVREDFIGLYERISLAAKSSQPLTNLPDLHQRLI